MTPPSISRIARERRHTLFFLRAIRSFSPVFLDTEVDATELVAHRAAAGRAGNRISVVTYVLHAVARALAAHPEANAAIGGFPARVARHDGVHGKLTLDRTLNGQRIVLAAVLRDLQSAGLDEIQAQVERYRDGDPASMPEFAGARTLHGLPWPVARLAFLLGVKPLARRSRVWGTFAVTSLGHRPVDGFQSVGGTTTTFGVGRIVDRPVARDGEVVVAPVMRLSMAFDHRVIDGAEAADVLEAVKTGLERLEAVR